MRKGNIRDIAGGLIVAMIGLFFLIGAMGMRMGTAMQMGPGYFPLLVSILVTVLGLAIVAQSFVRSGGTGQADFRAMFAVVGAVAVFAIMLKLFGLIPAMAGGVVLAAAGDRTSRPWQVLVLAVFSALGAWLIFRVGLGLQMPAFRFPA